MDHSPLKESYSATNDPLSRSMKYFKWHGNHDYGMPPSGCFFHEALLRVGSTMSVFLPPVTTKGSLPRDVQEVVSFGSLDGTLAMFNITPGSAEAAEVDETLRECFDPPHPGEQKACTTSVQDTVLAATRMLGDPTGGVWAAASALTNAGLPRRSYVVQEVARLPGERLVSCHVEPFPYAVYRCHYMPERPSRAYAISIQGLGGGEESSSRPLVAMVAVCHLDTSDWDPVHPAFKMMRSRPGGAPVCHFLPYANMVFGEQEPNGDVM
jgi:hypothetical protein